MDSIKKESHESIPLLLGEKGQGRNRCVACAHHSAVELIAIIEEGLSSVYEFLLIYINYIHYQLYVHVYKPQGFGFVMYIRFYSS